MTYVNDTLIPLGSNLPYLNSNNFSGLRENDIEPILGRIRQIRNARYLKLVRDYLTDTIFT